MEKYREGNIDNAAVHVTYTAFKKNTPKIHQHNTELCHFVIY
jgi:hypothetical protein